ncbi:unnamed protein product [Phytomonas sp. Hart1]|nr:unnamed protein product [Phytomonas sp. Hart1]|eukprot:CCW69293.1 unnamed protein product [Phytomonas sp. isolate Hart1]
MRRRTPWWIFNASDGVGRARERRRPPLLESRRDLKTLDVREYRPLGTPIEFRFYQRYTNHPNRQSGIQFLTHYNTHQRFRVKKDYIDYMNWGKEQGQARLPHRHQRVAFDFHDSLHPTLGDDENMEWFRTQDPTMGRHPDLSPSFDPNQKVFSHPEHWNKMFSKRRPGEGEIKLNVLDSQSLLGPLVTQTDTPSIAYFHTSTQAPSYGKVPGLNSPFLGEMDRQMMQAMSYSLNKYNTLTANDGRFSKTIFINDPKRDQCLSGKLAKHLNRVLDQTTNAVYSKLTVLTAAQSGRTEFFCGGLDLEEVGLGMSLAADLRARARELGGGTSSRWSRLWRMEILPKMAHGRGNEPPRGLRPIYRMRVLRGISHGIGRLPKQQQPPGELNKLYQMRVLRTIPQGIRRPPRLSQRPRRSNGSCRMRIAMWTAWTTPSGPTRP